MSKKAFLLLVVALPLASFAQRNNDPRNNDPRNNPSNVSPRERLEREVQELMMDARKSVSLNVTKMSEFELRETKSLLYNVIDLAEGRATGPSQGPINNPRVICSQSPYFQDSFIKIKNFAYMGDGLNMTSTEATNYATKWTNENTCEMADKFIVDFKRIRAFAYSGTGLNMTSAEAIKYASNMVYKLCSDVPFETIFQKDYNFAYSGSGLNMTSSNAINYARPRMELQTFNCDNN